MGLFSHRDDGEPALILDIGSGSVGAALVLLSRAHPASILYTTREPIPMQREVSEMRLCSLMSRTLAHIMLGVVAEGFPAAGWVGRHPPLEEAVVVLGAPWVSSQTMVHHLTSKEPMRITERVFAKLLATDDAEADGRKGATNVRIEETLIRVTLNGYETSRPFNKTAVDANFTVQSSFAPSALLRGIEDTIAHSLHLRHSTFHSFTLAAFAAARELFPELEHFVLADIRGELTELALVKHRALAGTASFPIGRNALLRTLQAEIGASTSGAETFLTLHAENRAEGSFAERGRETIRSLSDEWIRHLTEALDFFSGGAFLPCTLVLTADEDTVPLAANLIRGTEMTRLSLSPELRMVQTVTAEILASALHWSAAARRDPFLGLEVVFANLIRRGG